MPKNRRKKRQKVIRAPLSTKQRFALLFVPRRENDYRPYLARRHGLLALLIVALGLPAVLGHLQGDSVLGVRDHVSAAKLVASTNKAREGRGLPGLTESSKLAKAAASKAQDMFTNNYWSHVSPDGVEPWHWLQNEGYAYSAAGENLAKDFGSNDGVMSAWLASTEHRANIMNGKYSEVGITVREGELDGRPTQLIVALYGTPQQNATVAAASTTEEPKPMVLASTDEELSLWQRTKVSLQSMKPGALFAIVILAIGGVVALLAHAYRKRLPLSRQETWYKNHGVYKVIILATAIAAVIALYSGGQI